MPDPQGPARLSAKRARLASFENAYVVALRIRAETGCVQLILRTDNPVQPYRVVARGSEPPGSVLALVA